MRFSFPFVLLFVTVLPYPFAARADDPKIAFQEESGKLVITIADDTFGTYLYRGEKIPRPYFENVYAPNGIKATRNYPTLEGDQEDHPHHPGIWSKPAAWLDYSGPIEGQHVGITLMTHSDNFSKSWWHARDYGVFAANPFGPLNASNKKTTIRKGESRRLRFALLVHSHPQKGDFNPRHAYVDYLVASENPVEISDR